MKESKDLWGIVGISKKSEEGFNTEGSVGGEDGGDVGCGGSE